VSLPAGVAPLEKNAKLDFVPKNYQFVLTLEEMGLKADNSISSGDEFFLGFEKKINTTFLLKENTIHVISDQIKALFKTVKYEANTVQIFDAIYTSLGPYIGSFFVKNIDHSTDGIELKESEKLQETDNDFDHGKKTPAGFWYIDEKTMKPQQIILPNILNNTIGVSEILKIKKDKFGRLWLASQTSGIYIEEKANSGKFNNVLPKFPAWGLTFSQDGTQAFIAGNKFEISRREVIKEKTNAIDSQVTDNSTKIQLGYRGVLQIPVFENLKDYTGESVYLDPQLNDDQLDIDAKSGTLFYDALTGPDGRIWIITSVGAFYLMPDKINSHDPQDLRWTMFWLGNMEFRSAYKYKDLVFLGAAKGTLVSSGLVNVLDIYREQQAKAMAEATLAEGANASAGKVNQVEKDVAINSDTDNESPTVAPSATKISNTKIVADTSKVVDVTKIDISKVITSGDKLLPLMSGIYGHLEGVQEFGGDLVLITTEYIFIFPKADINASVLALNKTHVGFTGHGYLSMISVLRDGALLALGSYDGGVRYIALSDWEKFKDLIVQSAKVDPKTVSSKAKEVKDAPPITDN